MPEYPKFRQKLVDTIIDPAMGQNANTVYGVVLSYDRETNTASIVIGRPGTNAPGEIFANVPCPVVSGIQGISPSVGRMCLIAFRSGSQTEPFITHFFDPDYETRDYHRQYYAKNEVPQFLGLL